MGERTPLMAGNWKMNLSVDDSLHLVKELVQGSKGIGNTDVLIAPPFTNLQTVKQAIGNAPIQIGGQNMYWEMDGAFTGEISGRMLIDVGCTHVILGHSERRSYFHETDKEIDLKAKAAQEIGLVPIICIGETLEERETGRTFEVLHQQLEGSLKHYLDEQVIPSATIIAYEPVWAIGTGRTATPEQAQEVHHLIRKWLEVNFDRITSDLIRILYGGSVKPDNIKALMSQTDIDGALVGGASLKAESFIPIMRFQGE